MVARIIEACARNRLVVLLGVGFASAAAILSIQHARLDAIPDLGDPQVIVYTEWMGRSPTVVEDQVTYPLVTSLLGAPRVADVRGYSMFGMSFVYVIFEEGTDIYWRARASSSTSPRARRCCRPERCRGSGRRRQASAGPSSTLSSIAAASTGSTSSAHSRTSRSGRRSRAFPASPRWRASADTRSSTR